MADPPCSAVSLALDEPLQATASAVRNWVLIEQPGAWGPDALHESAFPQDVAAALEGLAREHRFRILLLRRPERPSGTRRHCFVAHSGRRSHWVEERVVADVEELLAIDFGPLRDGQPVGFGPRRSRPLYLVCTNGRHDPCCANQGRPVARALRPYRGGSVWECSHFGGDRFAGNLVCLPHGLYYGRLSPADAVQVVELYERGTIDLDHYRGQAGEAFAVQAAEFFLRSHAGLLGVDDLRATAVRRPGGGDVEVAFAGRGGRRFDVRVAVRPAGEARPLSCHAAGLAQPPTYSLVDIRG